MELKLAVGQIAGRCKSSGYKFIQQIQNNSLTTPIFCGYGCNCVPLGSQFSPLDYKQYACKQYAHCTIDCKLYKIFGQGVP